MIISAAILFEGIVYVGRRHHDIIKIICDRLESVGRPRRCGSQGQGFITDKGEFKTREEAAKIALACGQIKDLKFSSTQLFSEDLY